MCVLCEFVKILNLKLIYCLLKIFLCVWLNERVMCVVVSTTRERAFSALFN